MYEYKTYENIKKSILSRITNLTTIEGSFVNDMVNPIAMELEYSYRQFNKVLAIMFLKNLSGDLLKEKAAEYGLFSKKGTYSECDVKFTGAKNTVIKKDTLVSTSDNLLYETIEEKIILDKEAIVRVRATEIGVKYNVPTNVITKIPISIAGVSSVTNSSNAIGGSDVEEDEDLLNRILFKLQNPSTSGNPNHYKQWSLEVEGVSDCKVFPLGEGDGTVLILPITEYKRSTNETTIENIKRHIEVNRPIGATVIVKAPKEIFVDAFAKVKIDTSYSIENIKELYTKKLKSYIENSVFKVYTIDYYRCLSFLYEIEGILEVTDFKLNNTSSNIHIDKYEIQVLNNVNISL